MKRNSRSDFSFKRTCYFLVGLAASLSLFADSVFAVPLQGALETRAGFNFPLGDPDASSYDGSGFSAFKPFDSLTGQDTYRVNSFTGQPRGSQLEVFMLSEVAAFDGRDDPGFANQFGAIDSQGNFVSLIDSLTSDPLASGSMMQGADEELTLALQSPEGLFSSIDQDNPDQAMHILAKEVVQDGEVVIDPATLRSGDAPVKFSLLAGDVILFIEDMLITGNRSFLVPSDSDFDYNDMVIVVRQVEIPEPTGILLLGSALFGFFGLRRK